MEDGDHMETGENALSLAEEVYKREHENVTLQNLVMEGNIAKDRQRSIESVTPKAVVKIFGHQKSARKIEKSVKRATLRKTARKHANCVPQKAFVSIINDL